MSKILILIVILAVLSGGSWLIYEKYSRNSARVVDDVGMPSLSKTPKPSREIEVFWPLAETTTVGTKFIIYGKGRAFENTINYRISDRVGRELYVGSFMTNAPDAGIFGYFHEEVDLAKLLKNIPPKIILDVMEISAKDGSDLHKTNFLLNVDQDLTSVFAYFINSNLDPDYTCQKVFALPRLIPKTQSVLRASIETLLKGLDLKESQLAFYSVINKESMLRSASIENGIAYLDFNENLENAGGACNATAIRSQIEATTKQFISVKSVVISINGKTEGVLQP